MKQRTLTREVSVSGQGLHTGEPVQLTFKPAPAGSGLVFKRTDLPNQPEITPRVSQVTDLVRNTTIQDGHTKINLVEHVLSALSGCGIDNCLIEMDSSEPPILDGSAKPFVDLILSAEPIEQEQEREYYELTEPVSVTRGDSSIIALPHNGLKITCTSADDRGIHTQHLTIDIDPDAYMTQIAASRTFTIYEDIEELLKLGKIKGGSLDCAVVIKGDKIISKDPLRFQDEFVRHKILDIIGDITLLGKPLKAHIIATRPGHAINAELTKAVAEQMESRKKKKAKKPKVPLAAETELDITRILETIPHRYPFVMVDRVLEFVGDDALMAVKNVTFNEPYFTGHFPGAPLMPGVLQLEAMAQAAGIIMLRKGGKQGSKAFFMSADKVKFRRPVGPGDQLIINAKIVKTRGNKMAQAECTCSVDGKVVSSAEVMFALVSDSDEE